MSFQSQYPLKPSSKLQYPLKPSSKSPATKGLFGSNSKFNICLWVSWSLSNSLGNRIWRSQLWSMPLVKVFLAITLIKYTNYFTMIISPIYLHYSSYDTKVLHAISPKLFQIWKFHILSIIFLNTAWSPEARCWHWIWGRFARYGKCQAWCREESCTWRSAENVKYFWGLFWDI